MIGLNNKRGLIKLGLSCCALLIAGNNTIALAIEAKKKKVAIVAPTTQKKTSDADDANIAAKKKQQSALEAENALNRARLEQELAATIAKMERLRLKKECHRLDKEIKDESLRKAHDQEMLLLNLKKERLAIELELEKITAAKEMMEYEVKSAILEKEILLERGKAQFLQEQSHRLQAEIEALQAQAAREKHIQKKPIYLKDPLDKRTNTLILSDRCIDLNGMITPWKANYIIDQIHYFNNKNSEWPIFIIIDNSPGGEVTSGWNILQAMEYSKAPVYVVVKRWAMSMAAVITTLATKSYAYPNAEIMHHQPVVHLFHNGLTLRETKELHEKVQKQWERLGGRVAKKMGISLAAFDKKFYKKSMYGYWFEYANNAKKLKWVDYVINGIQHSGMSTLPNAADYTFENYIKERYGFNATKEAEQSEIAQYYQLAPHDFDYSYRPERKAEMMGNVVQQVTPLKK